MSVCVCAFVGAKMRPNNKTYTHRHKETLKCDTAKNIAKDDEASLECATESANWAIDYMKSTLNRIQCVRVCIDFSSISFNASRLFFLLCQEISSIASLYLNQSKALPGFIIHLWLNPLIPFFHADWNTTSEKSNMERRSVCATDYYVSMCCGGGEIHVLPWLIAFLSIFYKIAFFIPYSFQM